MKVKKSDMIAQIVTLPRRFQTVGKASMFSLVEATGYFAFYDQISETDIRAALNHCRECVREWIQYSEDQRTAGRYITQENAGCYKVGYVGERSH